MEKPTRVSADGPQTEAQGAKRPGCFTRILMAFILFLGAALALEFASDSPLLILLFLVCAAGLVVAGVALRRRPGQRTTGLILMAVSLFYVLAGMGAMMQVFENRSASKEAARAEQARLADLDQAKDKHFEQAIDALAEGQAAVALSLLARVREVAPDYPGLDDAVAEAEVLQEEALEERLKTELEAASDPIDREGLLVQLAQLRPENETYAKALAEARKRAAKARQSRAAEEAREAKAREEQAAKEKQERAEQAAAERRVRARERQEKSQQITEAAKRRNADLQLLDWHWKIENNFALAEGRVKNVSRASLKNVEVIVTYLDGNGELVTTGSSFIEYNPVLVDQISPFKVYVRWNPAIKGASIDFKKFAGGSVPFYQEK